MLFSLCKCKKCGTFGYSPHYDLTMETYTREDFSNDYMLLIESAEPPKSPNYLMFKCESCGHSEKVLYEEVVKLIMNSWSNLAWEKSQLEIKQAANFEQYFTRYLIDNDLAKEVKREDFKDNKFLETIIKAVENEEAERTKKSND